MTAPTIAIAVGENQHIAYHHHRSAGEHGNSVKLGMQNSPVIIANRDGEQTHELA